MGPSGSSGRRGFGPTRLGLRGYCARVETERVADRLIDAAVGAFSDRGYAGASVHEIARRAGLSTGAIYSRFSGKAELLLAAIERSSGLGLDQLFADETYAGRSVDILSEAGQHLVDEGDPALTGLLLEAFVAARHDEDLAELMRARLDERANIVRAVVQRAQVEGTVDPQLDADAVARFAHAIGLGFLIYRAIEADLPDAPPWETLIGRVVEGLRPVGGQD